MFGSLDGLVGTAYNQPLQASGGVVPLKWSVSPSLPPALTLDPASGVITGTPAATLTKSKFTFTVTDSATPHASASVHLTLEIKGAAFQVSTTALPDGIVGTPYNQKLQASGGVGPLKWSVSPGLPPSLALDSATGAITGTPTATVAKTQFKFSVTDNATPPTSATADLGFEIKAAPALRIITTALAQGMVGAAYNQQLQASGGVAPLKWEVNPTLPSPLVLDPATGKITGTPTATVAKTHFKFSVTDSATPAASVTADLGFEIKPGAAGQTP